MSKWGNLPAAAPAATAAPYLAGNCRSSAIVPCPPFPSFASIKYENTRGTTVRFPREAYGGHPFFQNQHVPTAVLLQFFK